MVSSPGASVVVGVDGSETARVALRWAIAEAELWGVPLVVLHVWREPRLFIPEEYRAELVEMGDMGRAALELIERELDAVGADAVTAVHIERREARGGTARRLIEASAGAALLVLGRHGADGIAQDLIGPKVIQVAHHAACPLAVIPDGWSGTGTGIVVGVDGSEHAAAALRWALDEAGHRRTSVTAVLAWGLLDQPHRPSEPAPFDPDFDDAKALAALDGFVHDAVGGERAAAITTKAVNDLPARALIDASAGAELLVIGPRGLGGFAELLLGSVSHRCLVHSICPTVVIR